MNRYLEGNEDIVVAVIHSQPYEYILLEKYVYETESGLTITVPSLFQTNFASTPKIMWSVIPPMGNYTRAALVHDFLYSKDCPYPLSRETCDKIFREIMKAHGTSYLLSESMYRAVRLFGGSHFRT